MWKRCEIGCKLVSYYNSPIAGRMRAFEIGDLE